jgi:hypothetical protein
VSPATGRKAAGYSGTPLAKKLGVVAGSRVLAIAAPADYAALLAPLPERVDFKLRASDAVDIAHVFVVRKAELQKHLARLRTQLRADAAVWVSWPKRASGVASEVTENTVREIGLPLGFVDVKVCAVSDVWSGLKLVVRKALR